MHETLLNKYGVAQLGYYVQSIEESAKLFAGLFGAGPFYDMGVNPPKEILYRGKPGENNTRCALGHFNNVQIELIEGIKAMHEHWDGTRPLRPIAELMGR